VCGKIACTVRRGAAGNGTRRVTAPAAYPTATPYHTCGHLCCCGCGQEVITPLSPAQWSFTYDGENVSLDPSVGNWALPCQSHYWIRKGKVHWGRHYSRTEIADNRERDQRQLTRHVNGPALGPLSRVRRRLGAWRR